MSQKELAEAVGLPDDGTIAGFERGQTTPSNAVLKRLSEALDLDWLEVTKLRGEPTVAERSNPYKGLSAFRESDAELYFGRTAVTQLVVHKLEHTPLIAVIGASGSGKSSLGAAGVLPMLRRARAILAIQMRPGSRPFDSLAAALHANMQTATSRGNGRSDLREFAQRLQDNAYLEFESIQQEFRGDLQLFLIIDQFEELFTQCRDQDMRRAFIDAILSIAKGHSADQVSPRVLLMLRGDFFANVLADRPLADALQDNIVHLPPMSQRELEEAITRPAAAAGCHFEPGLVKRMLDDAGDEPGRIPLVQYCLSLLWQVRAGSALTSAAYDVMGGLDGAIASQAERVFQSLSSTGQRAVRRMVTQLIRVAEVREGSETRRRLPRDEVATTATEHDVLESLIAARLLTTDFDEAINKDVVELAHEAVIGHWARLQDWLNDDRQFLLWQQRLERAIVDWKAAGRDDSMLLRGRSLSDGEAWAETRQGDMSPDMRDFLAASIRMRELEASARASEQASFLLTAQPDEVPRIISSLRPRRHLVADGLRDLLSNAEESRAWRLRLALVEDDIDHLQPLLAYLFQAEPGEFGVLVEALAPHKLQLLNVLWESARNENAPISSRLRAACTLAVYDPTDTRWESLSGVVADWLATENPLHLLTWIQPLRAVKDKLVPHLRHIMAESGQTRGTREACALTLLQLAQDDSVLLAQVTTETSVESFGPLLERLQSHTHRLDAIKRELATIIDAGSERAQMDEGSRLREGQKKAVAAILLARLNQPQIPMHLFDTGDDPEAATQFVHQCKRRGVSADLIAGALLAADSHLRRYWMCLALGEFSGAELREDLREAVIGTLSSWYRTDPSAAVHSATGWLLTSWGADEIVRIVDAQASSSDHIRGREWFTLAVAGTLLPFVRIPSGSFTMGCLPTEWGAKLYETPPHEVTISRGFGLCTREVTRAEYERFVTETGHTPLPNIDDWSPTGAHPVVGLTWFEAEEYIEWLNRQMPTRTTEPRESATDSGLLRLPTEAEWEKACRAESIVAFSFGSDRSLLGKYGWFQENSELQTQESGILRPNRYGLYDMHGNCWEWCSDWYDAYTEMPCVDPAGPHETGLRVLRGGCWNLNERYARSACRNWHLPTNQNFYLGLRIALTLPD